MSRLPESDRLSRVSAPLRNPVLRTAAAVAAVVTLAAACGSSSAKATGGTPGASGSSSTSPTSTSPTSTAPAATGSTIKIGVIGSLTGSQASSSDQFGTVAPAWADYVNKTLGGIKGHPVQVFVADDGGDPAKAQSAEKTLVNSDKVVAIVVGSDNLVTAFDADAISKGIPLISGTANAIDWYTKAGMFTTVTDVLSGLTNQVNVAKQFGKATKFANLYCSEIAACAQADPPLKAAAAKAGVGYTSLAVSSTATSYTAECLKMQQEKVDYAQLNFSTAAAAKFVQDCQQQNYNPTWGTSAQSAGKDLLSLTDFTAYGPAYAFPSGADSPVVATFTKAMTTYAKGDNWKEGVASFTWTGLEALREALANAGTTVTAKDVTAGLNTFKDNDLGGLAANKLTFTAGKPDTFGTNPCAFVIGIKGGKSIAPDGLNKVCATK